MIATAILAAIGAGAIGTSALVMIRRRRLRIARNRARREQHLARTAHELRTPLTAVISALEVVREGFAESPDEIRHFLDDADLAARLFNLLGNAIRFSPAGGTVDIAVEPRHETVRVTVTDQGPGVPTELAARLFEPFATGHATDPGESTGLGLHISRELVQQMHGRIGHRDRTPVGSEFWFELPQARQAIVAESAALPQ